MRARWILALLAVVLVACNATDVLPGASGDPSTAASVNGTDIPVTEVEERLAALEENPQVAEQLANDPDGAVRRDAQAQVLSQLIQRELLQQAADELGVQITDEDIAAQREQVIEQVGGEEAFQAALEQSGLSEEELNEQLRPLALQQAISESFGEDVDVSADEVQQYYEENYPQSAQARHILLEDEATAQTALDRLAAGEDFAAVASELSTDSGSAEQGGDLGEVTRGQTVPAFEDAVFSSPVGEVVGPVESEFGFHVIEVTERGEAPPLAEVEEEIRAELQTMAASDQVTQFITERTESAEVVVNPRFGRWDAASGAVVVEEPLGEASEPAAAPSASPQAPEGEPTPTE